MHRHELGSAIERIARRRAKVDDRHREKLPDAPDSDPREVLDYLRQYSGPAIPLWVLQADVCDALTLNNWLWWEDRRRGRQAEAAALIHALLEASSQRGASDQEVGNMLAL